QPRADQEHWHRRAVAKKKHRQFVAVIVDHTNRRVLDVLESRDKDCVAKYLREEKEGGLLAAVEEVTGDMWDAYVNAATEVFGEDKKVTTAADGRERLQRWMEEARKLGLRALERFCKTLTNWMDKIANYFVTRSSNGRTEGFNHGLRSILWRAFGMTNFKRFRLRALQRSGRPPTTSPAHF